MGILDRFKQKDEKSGKAGSGSAGKKAPKEENVLDMVKEPAEEKTAEQKAILKENTGRAHHILLRHHLSEKTNQLSAIGRYVFKVAKSTNKIEVKKAIEAVYDVHVMAVNMINVSGKNRRQGKSVGRTQDWKKAIVTLKSGERIAGLSEGV
ncbi:MAG: 50S ribosomal protein L23 [Candidatus Doudnabacteria bacterium]